MTKTVPLVVIDVATLTYSRFSGRTCTNVVRAAEPLLAHEIELYRTNPRAILPDDPPETA